jgi:hypothetical protein
MLLHENPGKETAEVVSHERLYAELATCKLNRLRIPQQQSMYALTDSKATHRELLGRLEMSYLIDEAALAGMNFGEKSRVTSN